MTTKKPVTTNETKRMNLLPERCPGTVEDGAWVLSPEWVRLEHPPQSTTCCGCLEPLGRTGAFIRIGNDMVFHDVECRKKWHCRVRTTVLNIREIEINDLEMAEAPEPRSVVQNKFSGKFWMAHLKPGFKGPTITEFLKLLRLE